MTKRKFLAVDAASAVVLSGVTALEPEPVPLSEAGGRFTAEVSVSTVDLPGFDNSAMDGFAVLASDTAAASRENPVVLAIVGESRAGTPFPEKLVPGQAVGISTGAPVPDGADAILQKEIVKVADGRIRVATAVEPGYDVRRRGEVAAAGREILAPGTELGAVELGALASSGIDPVSCHRRPTVSLLTSGDELVDPGVPLGPGQIWNSNRFAVTEMVRESGALLVSSENAKDDRQTTIEALDRALDSDLTVVCGGVSVGDHDHVRPALEELGVEQLFWGLALKPGRPTWFGHRRESRVLGLPGNPVSALVVFQLLARPLLRVLCGGVAPPPRSKARLNGPVERLSGRLRAVPCHPVECGNVSELVPMPQLGSHDFLSLLGATRLALIEPGSGRVEAGEEVETLSLGDD